MMRGLVYIIVSLVAGPALGFSCNFDTECYEVEACAESDFTIEVEVDAKSISTDFGDLTIVAVKRETGLITLFATGAGSEYMLSVTPNAARLGAHINEGPVMVNYAGLCEGAF